MRSVKQMLDSKPAHAVHSAAPSDTVLSAIAKMAEAGIGALVVLENTKLVGILSERDYARKVILQGKSSKDTAVQEIMTRAVITTGLTQRARGCMRLMTEKRIRHLPVLDGEQVVGMLSIGDLLKAVIAEQQAEIEQLNSYIQS